MLVYTQNFECKVGRLIWDPGLRIVARRVVIQAKQGPSHKLPTTNCEAHMYSRLPSP